MSLTQLYVAIRMKHLFIIFLKCTLYTVIKNTLFQEEGFITFLKEHKIIHGLKETLKFKILYHIMHFPDFYYPAIDSNSY